MTTSVTGAELLISLKGRTKTTSYLSNRGSGSEVHWGIRRAGSERSVRQGSFWEKNKGSM